MPQGPLSILLERAADRLDAAGDRAGANELVAQAAELCPADIELLHHCGVLHRRLGDPASSFARFARVLELQPGYAFSEFEVGHTCLVLRQTAEALRWYRKAIASAPGFVPAYLAAARLERGLGHPEAALSLLDAALAIEPNHADLQRERQEIAGPTPRPASPAAAPAAPTALAALAAPAAPALAVVTMVYNEPDLLPIWLRYYVAQVGARHCYVIDDGSDDASTAGIVAGKVLVTRRSRAPLDEAARAKFVSAYCAALLGSYAAVLYCDVDEIVVADPACWAGLADYAARASLPVVTTFGLNVLQRLPTADAAEGDAALDPVRPVLAQRQAAFWASSICKPLLIRRPVAWQPGFHSADAPVALDGLFNFHLPFADLAIARRRQAKRRATSFSGPDIARHHRASDAEVLGWMQGWSRMQLVSDAALDAGDEVFAEATRALLASERDRGPNAYRVSLDLWGHALWRIPERFRAAF